MATGNGNDAAKPETSAGPAAASATTPRKVKALKMPAKILSTIQFPYRDLESGIGVAQAMLGAGGVALTTDQLAGVMGLQSGSGNFVLKLSTARIFGLVKNANGKYELTDLGFEIVDKDERRQKAARAAAFLTVPLYKRVFEEFRGRQLPPRPVGLEQAFVKFGVSPKQKEAARQAFDKSAAQAGFFGAGNERLIEPIIAGVASPAGGRPAPADDGEVETTDNRRGGQEMAATPPSGLHPFIQGLLKTLPEPETNWAIEGRAKWLTAAANCFDLIYKGSGTIEITAKSADHD
jgi:hypothetical protein